VVEGQAGDTAGGAIMLTAEGRLDNSHRFCQLSLDPIVAAVRILLGNDRHNSLRIARVQHSQGLGHTGVGQRIAHTFESFLYLFLQLFLLLKPPPPFQPILRGLSELGGEINQTQISAFGFLRIGVHLLIETAAFSFFSGPGSECAPAGDIAFRVGRRNFIASFG